MIYHEERLLKVHPVLAGFVKDAIAILSGRCPDWLIVCGWRNQVDQHAAYLAGNSKADWPNGKHNHVDENGIPQSLAVDLSPYPYDAGKDEKRLYLIAGYILALADINDVKLRIGADWDGDLSVTDQTLHDPFHFELII